MPERTSVTTADLEHAAAAVATAALARPCPVLFFHPETAALVGAGRVTGVWVPRGPFVAVEPPRRAADADELWQLARHRLVKALAAWRMQQQAVDGPVPTQVQLNHAGDALVAAEERRRLPGEWVALSADGLVELGREDLAEPAKGRTGVLWVSLARMPQPFPRAVTEARRRILAARQAGAAAAWAFGFPAEATERHPQTATAAQAEPVGRVA